VSPVSPGVVLGSGTRQMGAGPLLRAAGHGGALRRMWVAMLPPCVGCGLRCCRLASDVGCDAAACLESQ